MRSTREMLAGAAILLASAITPAAAAQGAGGDKAVAQALFNEALKQMKSGDFAEACPKLEKSQELDPGMGTQFRLAECYEGMGRTASAWALFVEVAEAAKREGIGAREAQSRKRAEALEPKLPALVIRVEAAAPDLRVVRDGAQVGKAEWGVRLPVDPGEHLIAASAPGKKAWEQKVTAKEGATVEIAIPPLDAEAAKPTTKAEPIKTAPVAPVKDEASSGSGQRVAAVVVGSVGVLGAAAGVVFGLMAKSQWDDALGHCQGGDTSKCDTTGIDLGGDAKRSAVFSTIGFGVGGAGVAAAVILWLTAPSSKQAGFLILPSAGPGSAGAAAQWRF